MNDQKKNHPLVEKILSLVEFDPMYENMGMPDPKVLYLSDEAKTIIKQEFENYFESEELRTVVIYLLELSNAFYEEGHKEIAISILEIVVTATEALKKIKKTNQTL